MTTATKPLPAHGTQYRYRGARNGAWAGCRCAACRRAHRHACTQRALAHLRSEPPLHDAAPLIAHINTLKATGMSNHLISRRANVSASTISYLINGKTLSCQRDKALRILAVRPGDYDDLAVRPVLATTRRIQGLYYNGHGPDQIAPLAGLDLSTVSHIANGQSVTVDGRTANVIKAACRILDGTLGPSRQSMRRARALGWAPLAAWDDIDDPNCAPDIGEDIPLSRDELAERRRDEVEHLAFCGLTPEQISGRVDLSLSTIRVLVLEWRRGYKRDRTPAVAA